MSEAPTFKTLMIDALKRKIEHGPNFLEELTLIDSGSRLRLSIIDHVLNFVAKICQLWVIYSLMSNNFL